ncbi:MAG: hypothetical protein NZX77_18250, partial [Polyangiaceae bacterium]|nr:hypothetical protein [Polyangiaceae bacterium]
MSSLSRALALWTRRCVLALVLGSLFLSCEPTREPLASARLITNRSELVGGDRALGDVGDFLLENDKVRIVIQREGYSRGFGVFGGSLIDADLRRPDENGTSGRGSGRDAFGELFPAFFTQACEVDTVQILDNGENGGPARIEASGYAGDFLELLSALNRAAIGSNGDKSPLTLNKPKGEPSIRYATTYELSPGASHVVIRFKVTNITSDQTLEFPSPLANLLLGFLGIQGVDKFTLPVGDVALFGATSKVFLPGAGFDLRFSLEEAYKKKIDFPAFPGLVTEWVAAKADDVSYGLLAEASEDNFVFVKRDAYEDGTSPITPSSMLIPFVASSFIGVFYQNAPPRLEPGQSFEVKKYFVLGSGDVGSVLDEIQRIQGTATGKVTGRVLDQLTLQPTDKVDVLVYQRTEKQGRRIFSQYQPRQGFFLGNLPPGPYSARVVGEGIPASDFTDFDIVAGQSTTIQLQASTAARETVRGRRAHQTWRRLSGGCWPVERSRRHSTPMAAAG